MKKDYIALLTITEFPRTSEAQKRLVDWLRKIADDIKSSDPDEYTSSPRFRLMK